MPIRMLRDWTDSERVNSVSLGAEVTFTRLIMRADDFGRCEGREKMLLALLFPLRDVTPSQLRRWLDELARSHLVDRYAVADRPYLLIRGFGQRLRVKRSKYPEPPQQIQRLSDDSDGESPQNAADCSDRPPEVESEVESEVEVEHEGEARARVPPADEDPTPKAGPAQRKERGSKASRAAVTDDERLVLDALAAATGRAYRVVTPQLRARVAEAGLEACLLVVAHLSAHPAWARGGKLNEYLDTTTPFRPERWDARRAAAEQWHAAGRSRIADPDAAKGPHAIPSAPVRSGEERRAAALASVRRVNRGVHRRDRHGGAYEDCQLSPCPDGRREEAEREALHQHRA